MTHPVVPTIIGGGLTMLAVVAVVAVVVFLVGECGGAKDKPAEGLTRRAPTISLGNG
jgi:hypothetical protein